MSESNTIVINTHPAKRITLCLEGKEYEIPAYMSIDDFQLFYSEEKESKDYKRAISAVLLGKITTTTPEGGVDIYSISSADIIHMEVKR